MVYRLSGMESKSLPQSQRHTTIGKIADRSVKPINVEQINVNKGKLLNVALVASIVFTAVLAAVLIFSGLAKFNILQLGSFSGQPAFWAMIASAGAVLLGVAGIATSSFLKFRKEKEA